MLKLINKLVASQPLRLYDLKKPAVDRNYLTRYTKDWGVKVVDRAWQLGDFLWTKYDEKF